jgi:hypothetical protein
MIQSSASDIMTYQMLIINCLFLVFIIIAAVVAIVYGKR